MAKLYRYPGVKPFSEDEKHLFFGRETDTDKLFKRILINKLTLLYAKSGLGKSSLLNAGVIPRIKDETDYTAVNIRFGACTKQSISPVENTLMRLPQFEIQNTIFDKIPNLKDSLWLRLKINELTQKENSGFLLIFDQFEEIFTFPEAQTLDFRKQLADLLYAKMPADIRKEIMQQMKNNDNFLTDQELNFLYKQPEVKVVLSIRSDRMSLLNQFTDFLPDILKNYYELQSLDRKRAQEAMIMPAKATGDFMSQSFDYDKNTIDEVLDYLSENDTKSIETFQLQTICQYCEKLQIENSLKNNTVTSQDLGELKNVFQNHYQNLILKIGNPETQLATRLLIEEQLIIDGNRISLPEAVVLKQKGITPEILKYLHDEHHLLRSEPNTVGGISYELSHDTLVAPIQELAKQRRAKEEEENQLKIKNEELRIAHEKAEQQRIEREKENKRQRTIITIVSIAAIISLAFAIFGYVANEKSKKSLKKAEEQTIIATESLEKVKNSFIKEANLYIEIGEYELALQKFKYIKDTLMQGTTTDAIEKRILKCENLIAENKEFFDFINNAEQATKNKAYKEAVNYYEQALKTNIEFGKDKIIQALQELNTTIIKLIAEKKDDIAFQDDEKQKKIWRGEVAELQQVTTKINELIKTYKK